MYPINIIENTETRFKPSPMPVEDTLVKNIRISETTHAIRLNGFDIYRNKFEPGFPQNTTYDICRQKSSSVFMTPNRYYQYRTPNHINIIDGLEGCES